MAEPVGHAVAHARRARTAGGRDPMLLIAGALTILVAYGSLVPFELHWISLSEARGAFAAVMGGDPTARISRLDFVTNALLFGLLGFMWMPALGGSVRLRAVHLMVAPALWVGLILMGAALEFAQMFVPARHTNAMDLVAQGIGSAVGISTWCLAGPRLTAPLRDLVVSRTGSAGRSLLLIYFTGYVMYAFMPLDVLLSAAEWRGKLSAGQINLVPFLYDWSGPRHAAWDLLGDAVLAIPIGALLRASGARRPWLRALALFAGIEVVQLFLRSRVCDTTDIVTGMAGVAVGVSLSRLAPDRFVGRPAWWYGVGAAVYGVLLFVLDPAPFDFDPALWSGEAVARRLLVVPFANLYLGTPFNALDQVLRKALLGLPLGLLAGLMAPRGHLRGALVLGSIVAWLLLIEVVQVGQSARVSDPTDVLLGTVGAVGGMVIAARLVCSAGGVVDAAEHR